MTIEAMKQALEALDSDNPDVQLRAATVLRAAIEQAEKQEPVCGHGVRITKCPFCRPLEQKPVAWMYVNTDGECEQIALYTAPRQWQGLTDEDIGLLTTNDEWSHIETPVLALFARAIEAKLKEKNG